MVWKNDKERHKLARMGIKSKQPTYSYYTTIVCVADKTFTNNVVKSNTPLLATEELGWLGVGKRFKTLKERTDYIEYLKKHGFTKGD